MLLSFLFKSIPIRKLIEDVKACKIIRCGSILKNNKLIQFPQHAKKEEILKLQNTYISFGCGTPLKLVDGDTRFEITSWDS